MSNLVGPQKTYAGLYLLNCLFGSFWITTYVACVEQSKISGKACSLMNFPYWLALQAFYKTSYEPYAKVRDVR
jgi:hypothetical protein